MSLQVKGLAVEMSEARTIRDESSVRATDLFRALLKNDIMDDSITHIHLICSENFPHDYMPGVSNEKVITYDLFSNPCGWTGEISPCSFIFDKILASCTASSTVMMDSMNTIFWLQDVGQICNYICKMKERFKKVICLVHEDTIRDSIMDKILFFSSFILKVNSGKPHISHNNMYSKLNNRLINVVQKKSNGKIINWVENFRIDENFTIHSEINESKKLNNNNDSDIKKNMEGLTTFRLNMKENEKLAKSNLILPYLRLPDDNEGKEGKIIYDMESGDELEDPDDDLDI